MVHHKKPQMGIAIYQDESTRFPPVHEDWHGKLHPKFTPESTLQALIEFIDTKKLNPYCTVPRLVKVHNATLILIRCTRKVTFHLLDCPGIRGWYPAGTLEF